MAVERRNVDGSPVEEHRKPVSVFWWLVEIVLDNETTRLCNAPRDIVYDGNTFTTIKGGLVVEDYAEGSDLDVQNLTISLAAGRGSESYHFYNATNWRNRRLNVFRQFWNDRDLVVATERIHTGRISEFFLQFGGDNSSYAIKSLNVVSHLSQVFGRLTNNDEQQAWFENDTIFDATDDVQRKIQWRREA